MTVNIRRFMTTISAGAILAIGASAASAATSPVVGTWEMNIAKSSVENPPKSETFTFASSDKGITLTSNVTGADGKQTSHTSDPSPWDGAAHATTDSKARTLPPKPHHRPQWVATEAPNRPSLR